jgi:hypothetical protein
MPFLGFSFASPIFLRFTLILVGLVSLASYQANESSRVPFSIPENLTENPLTVGDQVKIQTLSSSLEWLGPLAPIAISPFFGITMLAGLSQFGSEFLPEHSFISNSPVLSNPAVFWIFLGLTILTSLPRFTKISKPLAQAIDQLEAYAGIITIVVIRVLSTMPSGDPAAVETAMVIEMGALSFSADVLFGIAAIINIVVINSVKFFFEVMVWLIPVPFVDGLLELSNKSLCVVLMVIYVWSPLVATILNLILFTGCLLAFRWVNRRVRYLRTVLGDPVWAMISPGYSVPKRKELVVFPQSGLGPFPAKSKLLLQPTVDGWQLVQSRWFFKPNVLVLSSESRLTINTGLLLNSLTLIGRESGTLQFSKRYARNIEQLASQIRVPIADGAVEAVEVGVDLAKA